MRLLTWFSNHSFIPLVQTETLETILSGSRTNSGFYPEPDSRAGKEVGNKLANMPDSLHGMSVSLRVS